MIAYQSMTVREVIDTVMDKVSMFETKTKLDSKTIWKFLNNSRREVFSRCVPFKEHGFVKTVDIAHGDALPLDFTRVIRVIADDGSGVFNECRPTKPQDWWRVTNTARPHTINQGSVRSPVYVLWGQVDAGTNNPSDNTLGITPLAPGDADRDKVFFYMYPNLDAKLTYSASFSDLPRDVNDDIVETSKINVPYEFENLCILMTLWRCYGKIAETNSLMATYVQVQKEEARLKKVFATYRQTQAIDMQSLVNPEPSQTPTTTLQ